LYEAFRTVKQTFDPQGIFNPGRIVDTPPIASHLRFGPGYRTPEARTWFDYSRHGGFARAVEMCSGVGACRQTREGTMCPSFVATREEAHSTRGRANVLRMAMSGRLGEAGLTDRGVYDVLDLCLECRACKTECPTGVDMARYKSEFLAAYWERHGTPLRAHAFAGVAELAAWGSRLAPLSNLVAGSRPARWLAEQLIGVDPRRAPPVWARRTFRDLVRSRSRRRHPEREPNGGEGGKAVVFADTFTNHIEPDIGLAALEVLDRAGIDARVAPHVCCGRPLISQGFLCEARRLAEANVAHLAEAAARGDAIVFLEPSCLSAVREDAPALVRTHLRARARLVASQAVLFEEFLERECRAGRASLGLRSGPAAVALHAHCHQRSMGLAAPALDLLRRIPGCAVTDLDAGCCGMAGSFGYARDHYDVSRAIAERKLLPAARALGPGGVLVAAGTSCRHQVAHFTGVRAEHPATLLASLL
jgi:Fe-S oxidoreductase